MSGVLRPFWSMGNICVLIAAALAAAVSLSTAADLPVATGDADNSFSTGRNETSLGAFFKLAESRNLPGDCKPRATHVAAVLFGWGRNFPTRQQRSDGLAYRAAAVASGKAERRQRIAEEFVEANEVRATS